MTSETTQQVEDIAESLADFHGQLDDIYVDCNQQQLDQADPKAEYNARQLALAMNHISMAKNILDRLATAGE